MKALISVSDKTGIVDFAKKIVNFGYTIISSGGTANLLKSNNIEVIEVSEYTGFPECFEGRIKTLHPLIEGGILYKRNNKEHIDKAKQLGIENINLVVCNLYPFKETLNSGAEHDIIIENIDIGGPTMLRAAAKNYNDVSVVIAPEDYDNILAELEENGKISSLTNKKLAAKVFNHTAHYDAMIANYFNKNLEIKYPEQLTIAFDKVAELRYGENPHQTASYYGESTKNVGHLINAKQIHGKELSYNNINDVNGGLETLKEFNRPTIVAVKHSVACGVGSAETIKEAFDKAYEADPISIFGGIILSNRIIDEDTAKRISTIFIEVVIAPDYTKEALDILTKKKNVRILSLEGIELSSKSEFVIKTVLGGLLIQDSDRELYNKEEFKVVTDKKPTEEEMNDLIFAWKLVKHAKSNGIVIAKNEQSIGVGSGQVSRIGALKIAIKQGSDKLKGSVLASDAFFPFSDCVELAGKNNIRAIIQPGGSIRDKESIDMANKMEIAMVFTGQRHFKH